MNLAWIAAIMRPDAVTSTVDDMRRSLPEIEPIHFLAALILGEGWKLSQIAEMEGHGRLTSDDGVNSAQKSLLAETLVEGVAGLRREVLNDRDGDNARLCALSLLACSAAAELDDYETCDAVLEFTLTRTSIKTSDNFLLHAILLQQRNLRWHDSGRGDPTLSAEVVKLLNQVDLDQVTPFEMSPATPEDYKTTLAHIVHAVRQAAWSLVPRFGYEDKSGLIPSWQEQSRSPVSEPLARVDRDSSHEYFEFVSQTFARLFQDKSVFVIGSKQAPELFQILLPLELLGHSRVYRMRRETALMRLVQSKTGVIDIQFADALRLLRHSGSESELKLAVTQLRLAGPISALSSDVRQIMLHRTKIGMLRPVELIVLQAGAELLTAEEARRALTAVRELVYSGELPNNPGHQRADPLKFELAWKTAAALGNASNESDDVAAMLLDIASRPTRGNIGLWDQAIGRALMSIDWVNVSEATKLNWSEWLLRDGQRLPVVTEVMAEVEPSRSVELKRGEIEDLGDVAKRVNEMARDGDRITPEQLTRCIELTVAALRDIQDRAARGESGFGGLEPSEVAAALISVSGASNLWSPLTDFLLDSNVSREHRSPAFERLSGDTIAVPQAMAEQFSQGANLLLDGFRASGFGFDTVIPYPAALRFLSCHNLISEGDMFSRISRLAGSDNSESREQAAISIAEIAKTSTASWMLALATQLSHDTNVVAKSHAGRALALLSESIPELRESASQRIVELLNEDGMMTPLMLLRELTGIPSSIAGIVRDEVIRLADEHPSRLVRRQAAIVNGQSR